MEKQIPPDFCFGKSRLSWPVPMYVLQDFLSMLSMMQVWLVQPS